MIWVALFGAVGAVINGAWSFYRWKKDTTYVAWTIGLVNTDTAAENYEPPPRVIVTNSGTAHAYNMELWWVESVQGLTKRKIAVASYVPNGHTDRVPLNGLSSPLPPLKGWQISYTTRPGRQSKVELWDVGMTRRLDKPGVTARARAAIGGRIAGQKITPRV